VKVVITGGSGFIGTNLVEKFLGNGWEVLNFDVAEPRDPRQSHCWKRGDILDRDHIVETFSDFQPNVVLHMAARTDLDENRDIRGYAANIDGVANVIEAVRRAGSVEKTLFASTRLVFEIGYTPKSEVDYKPSTLYGQSKIEGERLVREASGTFGPWVIVRPTSIWGPWFDSPVPYKRFFTLIAKNRYVHPGRRNPRKSFGFVGNTVYQVERILETPSDEVNEKTLWLSDYPPLRLRDWADEIQRAVGADPIRSAPMPLLKLAATAGDAAKRLGWQDPPLTNFRLDNMITEMVYDTSELESIAGPLPFSVEEGVALSVEWLRNYGHLEAGTK
jgi:nucleoside-diphosphate-sugar epimerase